MFPFPELGPFVCSIKYFYSQTDARVSLVSKFIFKRNLGGGFIIKPLTLGLLAIAHKQCIAIDMDVRTGVNNSGEIELQTGRIIQSPSKQTTNSGAVAFLFTFFTAPATIEALPEEIVTTKGMIQIKPGDYLPEIVCLPTQCLGELVRTFIIQ